MKWVLDGSEPKQKGEYAVQMRHKNSIPDDPIERDWVDYIPGTKKWQVAPGWKIIAWLDETPSQEEQDELWAEVNDLQNTIEDFYEWRSNVKSKYHITRK